MDQLPNLAQSLNQLFHELDPLDVDDVLDGDDSDDAVDYAFEFMNLFGEPVEDNGLLDWGDDVVHVFVDEEVNLPMEEEPEEANLQSLFHEIFTDTISTPSSSSSMLSSFPSPPSSPLLKFWNKMLYTNWPQYMVVAATAAFLNGVSYTLV